MVRPAASRPHPSLHDPAPARGDRAGRCARLPPLPVRLAACGGRDPPRGAGGAPGRSGAARRVRGAARARGRPRSCRPASRTTSRPGSTPHASRAGSAWARLTPPAGAATAVVRYRRCARRRSPCWSAGMRRSGCRLRRQTARSARARALKPCSTASSSRAPCSSTSSPKARICCAPRSKTALAELVALGLVTSDSFAGLRALLAPSGQRKPLAGAKRRGRILPFAIESGGRWAIVRRAQQNGAATETGTPPSSTSRATLLRRYGVVFWRLLAREARMAAALARSAARLSAPRGARRNSRRPLRRRLLRRTIRLAGGGRSDARRSAAGRLRANGCRSPAPIRSISSAS